MQNKELLNMPINKAVIKLAIPAIIGNIFLTLFEVVDTLFVSKLGTFAIAGVAIAGSILFLLASFAAGLNIGTVAQIARFTGQKNNEQVNLVAGNSIVTAVVITIILSITGTIFSGHLIELLGGEGDTLLYGTAYLRLMFIGVFSFFLSFIASAIMQGAGDTITPMKISTAGVIVNIFLDWIMIFGKFGFPAMGVEGAALATIISRGLSALVLFYILFYDKHYVSIKIKHLKINFTIIKTLFKIGIPGSIQMFVRSSSSVVMMKIVSLYGQYTIAAYGIVGRIFMIFLLPGFGFAAAAQTLTGQYLGDNNPDKAEKAVWLSVIYYFILLLISISLTFVCAEYILRVFSQDIMVISIGKTYLRILTIGILSLPFGMVVSRGLQGAGDSMSAMYATLISLYFLQIPLALLLSRYLGLNEIGIWLGGVIANFMNALTVVYLFKKGKWKTIKIHGN